MARPAAIEHSFLNSDASSLHIAVGPAEQTARIHSCYRAAYADYTALQGY